MTDAYPRHGSTRHPITDPTGDLRVAYLARLEYDLTTDAPRTAITYTDRPTPTPVPTHVSRAYRRTPRP